MKHAGKLPFRFYIMKEMCHCLYNFEKCLFTVDKEVKKKKEI